MAEAPLLLAGKSSAGVAAIGKHQVLAKKLGARAKRPPIVTTKGQIGAVQFLCTLPSVLCIYHGGGVNLFNFAGYLSSTGHILDILFLIFTEKMALHTRSHIF